MSITKSKFNKNYRKSKKLLKKLAKRNKTKKSLKLHMKSKRHHRGGFSSSCSLATVKEPGLKLDALGSIAGLSIPESRGAIYRPNCKSDNYQAMKP
jgi:hypothetical protein